MLKSLSIRNYALINKIEIDFQSGFSVITGETGSGKSIILGALSLLLGSRPDVTALKNNELKCVIEGIFDIRKYKLEHFFEKNDIDYQEESLLRREVYPNGKSRAFVNDVPVGVKLLKDLSLQLIDVHSQNQNLSLSENDYQLSVIDTFAKNNNLLTNYKKEFKIYKDIKLYLSQEEELAVAAKADFDYHEFQLNQLLDAELKDGEQDLFEKEIKILNFSEEIKTNLFKVDDLLSKDEDSILSKLKDSISCADNIKSFFSQAEEVSKRLESVYIELQDLSGEVQNSCESVEYNPERIAFLNAKLDTIYSLQQKHRVDTISGLLEVQSALEEKILKISCSDETLDKIRKELEEQEIKLFSLSEQLTKSRNDVIPEMEKVITEQLLQLGMPNAKFKIALEILKNYSETGGNSANFLFSANKNASLGEINKVASGGEMSRIMLSIKYLISASTALPSIVFDEIDTGVSGEIADKMAIMMQKMAENIQVISITHLPQIACKGDTHFKVYKADDELETYSNIMILNKDQRIEELAKMLSGSNLTKAAYDNAKALLNNDL